MAGFQNFTPRTADLAKVWEGFNPAANFLGGMKAVKQMQLDEAAEARLRESAEVDRLVKETMLPYETRMADAKIGLLMAQKDYAASRANKDASEMGAFAAFEKMNQVSDSDIDRLFGVESLSPATSAPAKEAILQGGYSTEEELLMGPLSEFSPKEESGPLYNLPDNKTLLADLSDPLSVPDTGNANNLKAQTVASALTPNEERDSSPLFDVNNNPLTTLEIPEDKRKEIADKNIEVTPYKENAPEANAGVGAYLFQRVGALDKARDIARLATGPKGSLLKAGALQMEQRAYKGLAQQLGVDPGMGEYAYQVLSKSSNGMRRSPAQINEIVELTKGGMELSEASQYYDGIQKQKLAEKLSGGGGNAVKQIQDRQAAMKNFLELKTAASENQEDKTLQAAYKLSLSDMKSVYGDEWDRVEFGLNQQDFGNALKFKGQKVDLKGKPVEGLNAKTADQSRLEMIQSGLIPSVKILSKDGKLKVDDSELNKIPDGAYFAGFDENNAVGEFRKVNGKPVALFSKPAPSNEETPLDASIKEIEAKEAVANAESNKKRIQEIDREISALSSTFTERRESSFSPMGYSAPVSSRAKNKDELIRAKNRILELKKLKASLQK